MRSAAQGGGERTPMSDALAAQILNDHAYGLHESLAVSPFVCGYPRCDEAYWHEARREEGRHERRA